MPAPADQVITEINRFITDQHNNSTIDTDTLADCIPLIEKAFTNPNTERFAKNINRLPNKIPSTINLNQDCPSIGTKTDLTKDESATTKEILMSLYPWRKGPLSLFDIVIDAEWQSHLKWNRIQPVLPDLTNKMILDIGSNNGYYIYRMINALPKTIIGIDPYPINFFQYQAFKRYLNENNTYHLPIGIEQLPIFNNTFHLILCMGILYHRSAPIDALKQIFAALKPNGLLIVETLTYSSEDPIAIFPKSRYAKMPNVYFIPSILCLTNWLKKTGFSQIHHISTVKTTPTEQRRTEWMPFESLEEFLNPKDPNKTIEGYPAPQRSIITAIK